MSEILAPIGNGNLIFDCTIWCNAKQRRAAIVIRCNVGSLTALNNALRSAGKGEWRVTNWALFVGDDERGSGRIAIAA